MKSETDIAFSLLRGALDGTAVSIGKVETSQWWRLFRLLQKNHVAALASEAFALLPQEEKPSREILIPWLSERQKAEGWHRYQFEVQQDIIATMANHGIETLVLKGTHTAQYYPIPELREFGDLDLYFYNRHDEADHVAAEVLKVNVSNDAHHHSKYDYRGVTVESHYDFVNTHYPPSNRRYEALLKALAPSPTFEVLFLLRHMACHFAASRLTLRELVDWTLTCNALQSQVDWEQVQHIVDDYGMTAFTSALCQIGERHLGRHIPLPTTTNNDYFRDIERDIVYGSVTDLADDGPSRLTWKLRRWHTLRWKRRLVFNDPPTQLFLSSITSHAMKPQSIFHKQ